MSSCIVLVCTILSLLGCPPVVSQQDSEEQLEEIESQIARATQRRNIGIGLIVAGGVVEVVSYATLLPSSTSASDCEGGFFCSSPTFDTDRIAVFTVCAGAALVALVGGSRLLASGNQALRLWQSKKKTVTIRVIPPALTKSSASIGLQASPSCQG
jgi:hypothetical protein